MATESIGVSRKEFLMTGAGMAGAAFVTTMGFNRLSEAEDHGHMITQIAKFKLNMDTEEEGVKALAEMVAAVEADEPGVLAYICHRSSKDPEELVFFEIYKDEEALKAHGTTPHMATMRANFAKYFKPPVDIVRLDRVAGFSR